MKNAFDKSFALDMAKEQTPEVKVMSTESPKIETQREKRMKKPERVTEWTGEYVKEKEERMEMMKYVK